MKASRATIRQARAIARIEEKLDRVLILLGEVPPSEPDRAETEIEEISQETVAGEPAIQEVPAPDEQAVEEAPAQENRPKGKPKG